MWRAMTSPAFDFQGDPAQQGGTFILGPGKVTINLQLFVGQANLFYSHVGRAFSSEQKTCDLVMEDIVLNPFLGSGHFTADPNPTFLSCVTLLKKLLELCWGLKGGNAPFLFHVDLSVAFDSNIPSILVKCLQRQG